MSTRTFAVPPSGPKALFEPAQFPSVQTSSDSIQSWQGDLLVLGVHEDAFSSSGDVTSLACPKLLSLDSDMTGAIGEMVSFGGFSGKKGSQSQVIRVGGAGGLKAKYVGMVGLGKAASAHETPAWGTCAFQGLGAGAASLAKANRATSVAISLIEPSTVSDAAASAALTQIALGALLGAYESTRFKSKTSATASKVETVHVLTAMPSEHASAAIAEAQGVASGTSLTRYLVEAPPNVCTPTHLAEAAAHIAALNPEVFTLQVFDKAQCEGWGMGCYLGVAESSSEPLKFIHLKYTAPGGGNLKKVALVGKGVTFDSGGYNIKTGPGCMIELMKFDMGGAAAVLGAARIVGASQPAGVEVSFIIAACENMIAGHGLRPGDILTAANGKTVEVTNTDAEGRLTLADALWYAQEKCSATAIVDVATLTGACMVALGTEIAGLFTPSDVASTKVAAAARAAGEKVWRMPLEEGYFEVFKSPIADMTNSGSRMGGAISAAMFLKQYVKDDVEWAHIDMAGPVWNTKTNCATGFGAATLAGWAKAQGAEKQ